jgi:hypothetical protein
MNNYLIEIIAETRSFITVQANDEHEALKLAELQIGEHGQPSAPEFTYKPPKLLGGMDGK